MARPRQRSPNYSEESGDDEEDVNVRRAPLNGECDEPLNCYLIGIDLFNFKSYSGHHIIGPFTNVTAIIGPNGSGKSNLMDAISFALCMKSDKLRAKNIGSLVSTHDEEETTSSETQSAKDTRVKAYVKLIFVPRKKNGDRTITEESETSTEEDRTTVERRILQDNSCEYAIDGKVCSSQALYMRFLTRLGLNARNKIFLLFQGTVDSLVTKNSTAFTKIIEELSGSNEFAKSYDKLKDKLKEYEQQLHHLQSQKQSFQKSRGFVKNLQRQRDMNVDIIDEIEEIKVQMILLDLKKQSDIIKQTLEKLEEENEALTEIETEISVLEVKKDKKKKAFDEIEQSAQEIAREYRQSDLSLACQEKHNVRKLESQLKASGNRLKNAKKNRDSFRSKKEGSQNAIQLLKDKMEDLDKKIKEISERLSSRGDKLHITRQQVDEFNRLKNEFQQQLSDLGGYQAARDQERHLKFLEQKLALFEDKKSGNDNEIKSLESKVAVNNTIIEKLSQDIANFDEMLKESEKLKEAKTKELNDLIGKAKSDEKKMKEKRESLKKMYESMTRKQQRKVSDNVLTHLKNAYPGRVHGRFGELCLPENPKYRKAFHIVAGQYAKAILVDSFDTVREILSREARSLYQSETLIALDRINAPDLQPELRQLKLDGHPMFDIVQKPKDIARIEMAVRLAIGNTIVCTSRESARKTAYYDNQTRHFNAISAECGTYFKSNGEISAYFGNNNKKDDCDEDSYIKEELKFKETEKKYLKAQEHLATLKTELEPINAEVLRLRTHQNIARKHIEELKKENSVKEEKISQLKSALVEEATQSDTEQLKAEIQMLKERLKEFEEEKRAIKASVFQDFLSHIGGGNFADVESFELAYYQDHEKDILELEKLQKERENLAHETLDIENKNNDVAIWEKAVEEEEKKFKKINEDLAQQRKELAEKEVEYDKLLENGQKKKKEQEAATAELNKVLSDLKSANHRKDHAKMAIQALTTSMKGARKDRHDLYRKAFIDATELPITNEGLFWDLFANQEGNNVLEDEDRLKVNFEKIEEFANPENNSQEFHRCMFELEKKLKLKENELQTVTIGDGVDLDHEEREAIQNIRRTTQEIDKVRKLLSKTRAEFEEVKHCRGGKFTSFLERVSQNLDLFYKELTGNASSQAFLITEDTEEPYLFGVNYSCIAPGKSFQSMAHLSGGEKCLAAFAFIFSVYFDRFPSFFIMDEIDGPLDADNVNKLVSFMQGKSDHTQFICISHKINLFGSVNSLIGVTRYNFLNANSHAKSETFSLDLRPYKRQEKEKEISIHVYD